MTCIANNTRENKNGGKNVKRQTRNQLLLTREFDLDVKEVEESGWKSGRTVMTKKRVSSSIE